MPMTPDSPIGPGTFTRDKYSVTIAEDGKIIVKQDDWLSKYSWALYGTYDTLDVFVRPDPAVKDGILEIEDVDEIVAGETLIHVPTRMAWLEKQGRPPPKRHLKPKQPTGKEEIYSQNWMACDYGGLEGTYSIVSGGANVLGFRNMDTMDTFYYVYVRIGGGLGFTPGKTVKQFKNAFRAAAMLLIAQKFATANYQPVTSFYPFNAKMLGRMGSFFWTWTVSAGTPNSNYSYTRLTPYLSYGDICEVVFAGSDWLSLPGVGAAGGSGPLVWIA